MWMGRADLGAVRDTNVEALQSALVSLGKATGDPELKKVVIDGQYGPKTLAAVNRAFTTHIGPGQVSPAYRTGALTQTWLSANTPFATDTILKETIRRGGKTDITPTPGPPSPPGPPPGVSPQTYTPVVAEGISTTTWLMIAGGLAALGTAAYVLTQRKKMAPALSGSSVYTRSGSQIKTGPGDGSGGVKAWRVMKGSREIDIVFYNEVNSAEDVRRSLINHDGYDSDIVVKRRR